MKTQIIQLESHDDVISIRDKMGWSQTSRILLVWPEKGKILNRRLDLVVLVRHSRSLGSQLALVTDDPEVKYNAQDLGIPVFKGTRQAQVTHWRTPYHLRSRNLRQNPPPDWEALKEKKLPEKNSWADNRIVYWLAFSSSIVALLALAAFILPGASIDLVPKTQVQEISLPVKASEEFTSVNLSGSLPAHWTTILVEGRSTITSTGTVNVPISPAAGNVRFTNLTEGAVSVPIGTLISTLDTEPIWFTTIKEGKVPAGIGKTASLPIQAVQPGTSGNLAAGKIQAISGPLGLQLSVTNLAPTRNGVDKPAPAPSADDRARIYNQLLASLQKTALQELTDRYQGGAAENGIPIIPSLRLASIIEKSYTPEENTPAEQLQLNLRLEFEALEVPSQALQQLVTPLLDASLPDHYAALPGTLNITALDEPVLDEKNVTHWTLAAQRKIQAIISPDETVQLAKGLPIADARQRLSDHLAISQKPQIVPVPSWWPYTPFLSPRINVNIEK
jgi:hypothetical protein